MSEPKRPHELTVNYIEFGVTNVEATKRFYGDAFNWQFTDYGPTYASFSNAGLDGGFNGEDKEIVGRPLVILYSGDLEGAVKKVEKAGGKIVKAIFSFPGGRRFHFTDPSGNELAVWSDK